MPNFRFNTGLQTLNCFPVCSVPLMQLDFVIKFRFFENHGCAIWSFLAFHDSVANYGRVLIMHLGTNFSNCSSFISIVGLWLLQIQTFNWTWKIVSLLRMFSWRTCRLTLFFVMLFLHVLCHFLNESFCFFHSVSSDDTKLVSQFG